MASKFKCVRCTEEFNPGKWNCADSNSHTVATKTYYIKSEGLLVFYGGVGGGEVQSHYRKSLNFIRGTCTTADPEQQEFLDAYPGCVSHAIWQDIHLGAKEREEQSKREQHRLEDYNNDLLDQIKTLKEQAASGAQPILVASGKGK